MASPGSLSTLSARLGGSTPNAINMKYLQTVKTKAIAFSKILAVLGVGMALQAYAADGYHWPVLDWFEQEPVVYEKEEKVEVKEYATQTQANYAKYFDEYYEQALPKALELAEVTAKNQVINEARAYAIEQLNNDFTDVVCDVSPNVETCKGRTKVTASVPYNGEN